MIALTEFFHVDAETNAHHYRLLGVLFLVCYGHIYVLVCIQRLYCALLQMRSAKVTSLFFLKL